MPTTPRSLKPSRPAAPVSLAQFVVTKEGLARFRETTARELKPFRSRRKAAAGGSGDVVVELAIDAEAYEPDHRAQAILRGVQAAQALLEETGGTFTLDQVQAVLGISRQAVLKKVKDGALLAVPGPNGRRHYPVAQFSGTGVVAGLKEVMSKLLLKNPFAILSFLVEPNDLLEGAKPLDMMKAGKSSLVARAAELQFEQGA
jgi:hypothetical protein